jgi:glycosyltransferase involved in cell wall biosynthesis
MTPATVNAPPPLETAMKLSVMMITYNHEHYLRQALDSVLMQKVDFDYEIVVGEDHSSDATRQILLEYASAHPDKIRPIFHDRNIGVIRNFFSTLQACRGEYVALLEGDDYWTSDLKLQSQVDFLDAHPDFAISFHNVTGHFQDQRQNDFNYVRADQPEEMTIADLLADNVIPTCSAVFRRELANPLPDWLFELKMADYPLHVLTAQHGKIGYINQVMGLYRIHTGGVWTRMDGLSRQQQTVRFFQHLVKGLGPQNRPAAKLNLARRYWRLGMEHEARGERGPAFKTFLRSLATQPFTGTPSLRSKLHAIARVSAPTAYDRVSRTYGTLMGAREANPVVTIPRRPIVAGGQPRVSIVIPAYNAQRYLVQAVESMLAQTFTDFECIIVDDGSTDRTAQLLAQLARRDPRVRPVHVPHGGIVEALNAGIEAAQGEFIARMDADDVAIATRLEEQVHYMDGHADVVALGSKVLLVDPHNSPLWEIEVKTEHKEIDAELMAGNGWALFHPTSIIRKHAILQIGRYRPEYQWSEDIDLFLRLGEIGRLANMPTAMLRYRQHFASVNRTKLDLQVKRVERLLADAHRRRGQDFPPDFHFKPVIPLSPLEQFRAWGRRALLNGNFPVARRHAIAAFRFAPMQYDSWSLLYHSMIGR